MIEERINHSRIQRIVWDVGGVLDEVEREAKRKVEVRVGVMYTGKRAIGVGRRKLENKVSVTAIVEDSQRWQEMLLKSGYSHYDLEGTSNSVVGGDGNGWVQHSFDRFEIAQEFLLDRFHLYRAARRASGYSQGTVAPLMRRCCAQGLPAVEAELTDLMKRQLGQHREKTGKFIVYLRRNAEGLVDCQYRLNREETKWHGLGAIEDNVDKLAGRRMKSGGRSWRLPGARAMLALSRHKEALQQKALHMDGLCSLRPVQPPPQTRPKPDPHWLYRGVPILHSCAEGKPWVHNLRQLINGRQDLSFA